MSQKIIGGINPVIAGTFKDDGSLDLDSMGRLIEHEIKIGANGITMFGIATEFHKLTDNERNDLAALLVKKVKNTNVFSVMSVTDHSTEVAVFLRPLRFRYWFNMRQVRPRSLSR